MIRLEIPAANGLIVVVSCVVGLLIYRRSVTAHQASTGRGDLVAALGATATCIVVLAFLFGLGAEPPALRRSRRPPPPPQTAAPPLRDPAAAAWRWRGA
ncbi:hypothetical protein GCM10010276_88210 [Streptomyces longisporus]|uniref:Uncharacterized protein n=1 Tax=Streptomyces longisporus TaxID=1948 RepID=A0ABN3NIP8_STRLO